MADNYQDQDEDESSAGNEDKELLEEAIERFEQAKEAEGINRREALDDLEFIAGKQWHDADMRSRAEDGRPCLTINKLPQVINQVTNDQRQNRPAIKVHPVDDQGDIETAKIHQGLIRNIEYNSNAEAAYDTAFEFAAKMGWGYWRVVTQYVDPISFEQEIVIKRIPNPFAVFFDPNAVEPDGSDASYAFVVENLSKDEYKARYPKSKLSQPDEWGAEGNQAPGWMSDNMARVAEYFYKENTQEDVVLLSNGETGLKKDLPKELPEGITIVKERTAVIPKVCWVKMNGSEILEKTDWPGQYIPIVPLYGNDTNINGKRIFKGIIRDAKDSARMYNYFASAESEAVALAPRAPFIADPKLIEGYEKIWETANRKNYAYLPYNMIVNGQPVPPPQRASSDISTQAITQARMLASDDIKATTGIYDASLGNKSNETSGVAIQRRNVQAQTSNFHFMDNLTRSLRHTGRILIDLIPKVYDTARTARIVSDDGEQRVVKVNDPNFQEKGQPAHFQLDAGKYDVTVDTGPSFQTKRQEATASMLELSKSAPQMMQIAPDLVVKNMDFPGATELAERFKKTLDPKLLDDGKGQQNQIPPQVQQKMQQMSQMVEQMTGTIHALQDEKDHNLLQLESRERIEFKKLEVQLQMKLAEIDAKDSLALLSHEIGSIKHRMQLLNEMHPLEMGAHQEQPQGLSPGMDGGQPAMSAPGAQDPTGGASPGSPMEGINQP